MTKPKNNYIIYKIPRKIYFLGIFLRLLVNDHTKDLYGVINMKIRRTFFALIATAFLFTSIYGMGSASSYPSPIFTLLPPICYTQEVYDVDDGGRENNASIADAVTEKDTHIRIRFKIVEILSNLWERLFS